MRRFAMSCWCLCAAVGLQLFSSCSSAAQDCQLKQFDSIEFTLLNDYIYVPVLVDGTPGLMILDTAAGVSYLTASAADHIGLHRNPLQATGVSIGHEPITQFVAPKSFALGRVPFAGADFLLSPHNLSTNAQNSAPVVGSLGMNFFAKMDLEIDFKKRRLNLYSQDHCPGTVVYWADRYATAPLHRIPLGNTYFPMEIDGQKIAATIATGNRMTSLPTDVTKRLYGFDEHSEDVQTEHYRDGTTESHYRAMAITGPGLEIRNTPVLLVKTPQYCRLQTAFTAQPFAHYTECFGGEAPLHLGMGVLEALHLYFATKENVLYFTAADASRAGSPSAPAPSPAPTTN